MPASPLNNIAAEIRKYPVTMTRIFIPKSKREYLNSGFKDPGHFRKSFNTVYNAAKTPSKERMMVKTGFTVPVILSSLVPAQVVTSIIPIIWKAIPEYFAKSLIPLFSVFFGFFVFCGCCSSIVIVITHFAISGEFCTGLD